VPPAFDRAAITLGIGPHSSLTSISDLLLVIIKYYKSVPHNHDDTAKITHIVSERTCIAGYTEDGAVTSVEVADSVKRLKPTNNDDYTGLSTNHF